MAVITDGTAKWEVNKIASAADLESMTGQVTNITVTKSTQAALSMSHSNVTGDVSGGSMTGFNVQTGISGGTYALKNLLQQLVNKSHSHAKTSSSFNCYSQSCSCSSCIIKGKILTNEGYKNIEELQVGDNIVYQGKQHCVAGIKTSKLGSRKAIRFEYHDAVFTDDHLFKVNGGYAAYDLSGYFREAANALTDGKVWGTYARSKEGKYKEFHSGTNLIANENGYSLNKVFIAAEFTEDIVTYIPIIEGSEWCIVDGMVVACARYLNDKSE